MAQETEGSEKKPGVKIQDLSPKKDAKGGFGKTYNPDAGGGTSPNLGGTSPNAGGTVSPDGGGISPDGGGIQNPD